MERDKQDHRDRIHYRLTQADLGRLLGNGALASLILNGHRRVSKSHIRKLADHFKVFPARFLQAD